MANPKLHGYPEEWDPRTDLYFSTLLEKADVDRIRAIERAYGAVPDLIWMAKKLREIALLDTDQLEFPQYAALVNPIAVTAFAMRLARHERLLAKKEVKPGDMSIALLDLTTSSGPCEAIMLARPYLKLLGKPSIEARQEIESASFKFRLDDIEGYCGCAKTLMVGNGQKCTFRLRNAGSLFGACGLDKENQANPLDNYGIMAPNGTLIQGALCLDRALPEPVTIECGVVAARYTTKAL